MSVSFQPLRFKMVLTAPDEPVKNDIFGQKSTVAPAQIDKRPNHTQSSQGRKRVAQNIDSQVTMMQER